MSLRGRLKHWVYGSCPGFAGHFPYYGTNIYFPRGDALFKVVCEQGTFEPEVVRTLTQLVQPGTFFFDVGANIGLMAAPVLQSCANCHVVSFEPSPNTLPFLLRTVSNCANRFRWSVITKGLSDHSGELDFVLGPPGKTLFEGFKSASRLPNAAVAKVPVSTLDEEWESIGRPPISVIKIDVEGAEGLVLRGSRKVLKCCQPSIVIEWHEPYLRPFGTPPDQLLSLAREFGYRIYSVPQGVPVEDARGLSVQMLNCSNFLLAPLSEAHRHDDLDGSRRSL